MEVHSITRHNTMTPLSKKVTTKVVKLQKPKGDEDKENELHFQLTPTFHKHPGFQYIRATSPSPF